MKKPLYATAAPSLQQTFNIFEGHWASKIPSGEVITSSGSALLFEDPRVPWAAEGLSKFGVEVKNSAVLELGPLEGAHTRALSQLGAASVTAVEASADAYLKCLLVKETLSIERVNFLYGDVTEFLKTTDRYFDIGFACGILYHLVNPVETIALLAQRCRSIFIWTVCWDAQFMKENSTTAGALGPAFATSYQGFQHTLHRHDYTEMADLENFWGGSSRYAYWMEAKEVEAAVKFFGFSRVHSEVDTNPWGTAIRLVATK